MFSAVPIALSAMAVDNQMCRLWSGAYPENGTGRAERGLFLLIVLTAMALRDRTAPAR
jgi:hypothetical protein